MYFMLSYRWHKILGKYDQAVHSSWLHVWIVVNKHDFNVDLMAHQLLLYNCMKYLTLYICDLICKKGSYTHPLLDL